MAAPAGETRFPVHPARVRAALDPRLNDGTIARLMACERLRGRLDAHLGLDGLAGASDASVLTSHRWLLTDPAEAARRAGVLLHGQTLRAILSGPAVGELIATIGREAHALGLRQGALMPPRANGGDLVGAILRDGEACLGAWLQGQPDMLRKAILLRLPPGSEVEAKIFDPDLHESAPAIMAQVARSFTHDEGNAHA